MQEAVLGSDSWSDSRKWWEPSCQESCSFKNQLPLTILNPQSKLQKMVLLAEIYIYICICICICMYIENVPSCNKLPFPEENCTFPQTNAASLRSTLQETAGNFQGSRIKNASLLLQDHASTNLRVLAVES